MDVSDNSVPKDKICVKSMIVKMMAIVIYVQFK